MDAADPQGHAQKLETIYARLRETKPFQPGKTAGKRARALGEVPAAAHAVIAGFLAAERPTESGTLWIVCESVRHQEEFYDEFLTWCRDALIFPEQEIAVTEGAVPDLEIAAKRYAVLERLVTKERQEIVVIHEGSLAQHVPSPERLRALTRQIRVGEQLPQGDLVASLTAHGYAQNSQVSARGQFAVRGGIVDFFSWFGENPVRLEYFGDEIESIREFGIDDQRSQRTLSGTKLLWTIPEEADCELQEYVDARSETLLVQRSTERLVLKSNRLRADATSKLPERTVGISPLNFAAPRAPLLADNLPEAFRQNALAKLAQWDSPAWFVVIVYRHEGEVQRIESLLQTLEGRQFSYVAVAGVLAGSFECTPARLLFIPSTELLGAAPQQSRASSPRTAAGSQFIADQYIDFQQLSVGELVVHANHGVAKFLGVESHPRNATEGPTDSAEVEEEVIVLEFAEEAKLYVPLQQSYLISRYVGLGNASVNLNALGGRRWQTAKSSAEKAVYDYAAKLLSLQAERETRTGFAFPPDSDWQQEFENTFPYRETQDQLKAISEVKLDMESLRPMDRLLCGDVGFGKTEVALRAAFKAVMAGKQVAIIVPTTVLAKQHHDNFQARMRSFPINVRLLSRLCSATEQREVVAGLQDGSVDIVIGTHRLISKDVAFKNVGLLVIDEEQRFGVKHKEQLKNRHPLIDILSLSATPIPRTLYLSLVGIRDLSTLNTPPPNRHPVETVLTGYDERIIRKAIEQEIKREGQVYYLHNRVQTIERVRERLVHLCPEARIDVGHGQMEEGVLEDVMSRFVGGDVDVLVATTIIESGLDIPNANTIIIDRADNFGLADLYQLRGRVGRAAQKAYAYLLLPRRSTAALSSRKRLDAIKQYNALGSGFKIALKDLEIRGAGNILGMQQSGHVAAVGFELYCQLLKQAVSRIKGKRPEQRLEVQLRLDFIEQNESAFLSSEVSNQDSLDDGDSTPLLPAYLPKAYVADPQQRIRAYRDLSAISSPAELETTKAGWRDVFGPLPESAEHLLMLTALKLTAARRRVDLVETKLSKLMLRRRGSYVLVNGKFPRLTSRESKPRLREIADYLDHMAL